MPKIASGFRLTVLSPTPLPYWRKIADLPFLAPHINDWTLVLNSQGIYWQSCRSTRRQYLYVSPIQEKMALKALSEYVFDNKPKIKPPPAWPLHKFSFLAPLYLLPLILVYSLQHRLFAHPSLTAAGLISESGSLDNLRIYLHHEWWRVVTALTLHVSLPHLVGNIFFGGIFLVLLARIAGVGRAWLLTCLGGAIGNLVSASLHTLGYASIGFSTALFASVGATGGMLLWRDSDRLFMPVAAALALLALLGTEGIKTDYIAHLCGLGAGCILGVLAGFLAKRHFPELPQLLAGLIAWLLPLFAWISAIHFY